MKKIVILLCLAGLLLSTAGCAAVSKHTASSVPASSIMESSPPPSALSQPEPSNIALPKALFEQEFTFSSGAGGWHTQLTIQNDLTFSGTFSDFDAGTVYYCEFDGKFDQVTKIADTIYTLQLTELNYQHEVDSTWEENGLQYIAATAYGISDCELFRIYLPETPMDQLCEEALSWYHQDRQPTDQLNCFALENTAAHQTFYS